ncbi:MAG: iron-containing alcohol dehydrogenase [Christensenellaceae bacterium]|jgi:alcohol dehydrogenase class IV|nr:iron-containing alcohol dehydrogenase [Christensenellaceae bacterium]
MNLCSKFWCRSVQFFFAIGLKILPIRKPEVISGPGTVEELPDIIKAKGLKKPLLVTDKGLMNIGLAKPLIDSLSNANMECAIYDGTVPNPTIDNIETGLKIYNESKCDCIIAFGGGSAMDCAKIIGARVVKPNKPVGNMKGYFKILKGLPPFFAIPTTSGTGSEATVAAVISNPVTHEKYPINDFCLVPHYAVLDPLLTLKLPKHITSTTGVDALTHAVEAYIGGSNTSLTRDMATKATKLIFENLKETYDNGENVDARAKMQLAAYYAGVAFTRAFVGYVHAIAHTIGGLYGTPHGLANAIILPYILDWYGKSAYKPLAKLADFAGGICDKTDSVTVKGQKFIKAIKDLNESMNIPTKIKGLKECDFDVITKRALKEGNPMYPVPKLMDKKQMISVLKLLVEEEKTED